MKRLVAATAALVIAAGASAAFAAPHGDDHHGDANHGQPMGGHPGGHPGWKQGGRIERGDWNRGQHVDYRAHHLRAPPRGYEWRQVDGNYVLAAVATGLIASVLLANQ